MRDRGKAQRRPPPMAPPSPAPEDERDSVDLYATLGLTRDASSGAIKKAYRTLALRFHPDKNPGDEVATETFKDIGKAYAILSDAKKKKYYDDTGDVEEIDVSAEDFVSVFQEMMREMLGGGTIADMLEGLHEDDLASMPPFPFPKALFPPGTFPPGMKFSDDFHVPPAVEELLESGGPEALAALFSGGGGGGAAGGGAGGGAFFSDDSSDEWEEEEEEEAEGTPRMPPRAGGRKSASAGRTSGGPKPGGSSSRGGETASHTTPFAWCTPFLKDFSRHHSSPALPFQRLTGKTFD